MRLLSLQDKKTLLDFVMYHIISIELFSGAGLSLTKGSLNRLNIHNHNLQGPIAALYSKALPLYNSMFNWTIPHKYSKPCLLTTGYSIQVLLKTAEIIKRKEPYTSNFIECYHGLLKDLEDLGILQFSYCMEKIEGRQSTIHELSSVLEGGLYVIKSIQLKKELPTEDLRDMISCIMLIKSKLESLYDPYYTNSFELGLLLRSFRLYNEMFNNSNDDLISEIALETMNRQNRYGLIYESTSKQRTAPLSHQFLVIDSLLSVYPIVKLDVLYEKAFCIFNKIYRLAWNEAAKCFSISKNCRIKYTAYELGVIIRCLGRIAKWADGHEQQMWIETTLQQFYLKKIFTNFIKTNRKTITSLIDLYCSLNIQDKSYEYYDVRKIKWSPIFPNKISFNYPGPTFNWTHSYHIVALKNPLFLCSCILDLLLDDSEAEDDNQLNSFFELLMEMLSINRDG